MYNAHIRARILAISREVRDLEEKSRELREELAELLANFRKECKHEMVVQGEFWSTDERCIRICANCGLEEDGRYDEMDLAQGHTHLSNLPSPSVVHKIPREDLEKYRTLQPVPLVKT